MLARMRCVMRRTQGGGDSCELGHGHCFRGQREHAWGNQGLRMHAACIGGALLRLEAQQLPLLHSRSLTEGGSFSSLALPRSGLLLLEELRRCELLQQGMAHASCVSTQSQRFAGRGQAHLFRAARIAESLWSHPQ